MNRRRFLEMLTVLAGYIGFLCAVPCKLWGEFRSNHETKLPGGTNTANQKVAGKTRVVLARNQSVLSKEHSLNSAVADQMLEKALLRLTDTSTLESAWGALFTPDDIVGIKVNALGGKRIATQPVIVDAIVTGLKRAGVPENNIVVWDRLTDELQKAGYRINRSKTGVRCYGTDTNYEREPEMSGSIGSCFSRILSSQCTALINVPVLKDHDLAGVSISLKNFYGAIHNPNKYHDNNCDPYIADVNKHTYIKDKLRLIVCDATTLLYHGGPAYKPQYAVNYCGVLVSRDPVAVDTIGVKLIEDVRREKGLEPLREAGREPVHVATAAKQGLGTDDLSKIDLIKVLLGR
ncbi:MAG: DUF362 domain-containing protein [Thermodesulfobacteriota bacterium]|nr:DUF362 domain-containing protein [Thermodesulfobacteriota bacterium]